MINLHECCDPVFELCLVCGVLLFHEGAWLTHLSCWLPSHLRLIGVISGPFKQPTPAGLEHGVRRQGSSSVVNCWIQFDIYVAESGWNDFELMNQCNFFSEVTINGQLFSFY